MNYICLDPDCPVSSEDLEEIVQHIDEKHPTIRKMLDEAEQQVMDESCHCGRPIHIHEEPKGFTRGLCRECDLVRCDAYPQDCPYRNEKK